MLQFGIYVLYRVGTAAIGVLPLRLLFRLGTVIGFVVWALAPNYRRLARRNVEIAFGEEKSRRDAGRLVRRHFQRLAANLFCGIKMTRMSLEAVRQCVEIDDESVAIAHRHANRPTVVVLSHLSNWEAIAQLLPSLFGHAKMGTVYQRLRNKRIDDDIRRQRGRAGVQLFERSEGFGKTTEFLRSGGGLGVLSDQHAGDAGVWTPFFGRLASTTTLPALLAKRTGAAVLVSAVHTVGPGRWRLSFSQPIDLPEDTIESLTAKMNEVIEQEVRRVPEDWFWVHNRWKTPDPNFLLARYKRGVYLPPQSQKLKPFRILVRGTNWLGDSVISAAAVRAIKRGRPDAHITVAAPEKLASVWKLVPQ
ncbi:MAG TPA: hypothetical protein VF683_10860, partial [Chthoniobacterales bacterium]